ncbi:site-specific integrase [Burkholderia multivorans]|uniref:phage integrase family protein n=1 Tax=Burkholderia multivorans TaxID=87883 RepID=UPI001C2328BF|nr:phage integrase family protein [Burkholderia multivorans]MBU9297995.1 site-specific integrase [Burkholderia multivorans]MBU9468691.1 site-specific integrase [Burkholderia multivorans]MBY4670631.1 site-specific integrase [Burkholderia multivorans]MCA8129681.1 site-specific integrase [Burkholderia multivorans]MDN7747163.1 phage integrase family protein [Burkholderia multivorans]
MKTRETLPADETEFGFPDDAELAALRSWYAGLNARAAVARYLGDRRAVGASSRGVLGRIRRQLSAYALARHRADLAAAFVVRPARTSGDTVARAIESLRILPAPVPLITDAVDLWLPPRIVAALRAHGIRTLADLTVRIPRRRRWWSAIAGLGVASARRIEAFFAAHPALTERARALIVAAPSGRIVPWEQLRVPHEVDGSRGQFRAPRTACLLNASNDYEAIQSWLSLHESAATQRAYRKEAERLILWAIVERGRALSSLTTDDAIAYRGFLRRPMPREHWIGPSRPRHSIEWRPFIGPLSARSAAYALNVLSALFRWLVEQHYVLANPFAGVKIKSHAQRAGLDVSRGFTEGEWLLIRALADGLEWSYSWSAPAAQRLRFLLDFGYATGLRASELVGATLGEIRRDEHGDHWLHVLGKGGKLGKVALPSLARTALDQYLVQRDLPVTPARWNPSTPLVASLEEDGASIEPGRLWRVLRRFFVLVADTIADERPATAEKLRRASPHWMRHTHASHALARGAELIMVRDNLRHSSISTTSTYLHSDEVQRARQFDQAFGARKV